MQVNWITLSEYSAKYKVSVSTLRRRLKKNEIVFQFENGKYIVPDQSPREIMSQKRPFGNGSFQPPHTSERTTASTAQHSSNTGYEEESVPTVQDLNQYADESIEFSPIQNMNYVEEQGFPTVHSVLGQPEQTTEEIEEGNQSFVQHNIADQVTEAVKNNFSNSTNQNYKTMPEYSHFEAQMNNKVQAQNNQLNQTSQFSEEMVNLFKKEITNKEREIIDELKKAYSAILQEKEEQIGQLKVHLSDLKSLINVLESEVVRLKKNTLEDNPLLDIESETMTF